jgi:hypothetical protein
MRSLVNPLTSIATALNRIAAAIESKSSIQIKTASKVIPPTTTTTTTIPTAITNQDYQYSSEMYIRVTKKEKEVLDRIYRAITDKGPNQMHHDKVMDDLRKKWPVLHAALIALAIAKADTEKSKLHKHDTSIWKKNDTF